MSAEIIHISDDNFEQEVLNSDVPVLVDYWAEWCGPCKMIAPVLDEIAQDYEGKLKVCKVDVESNRVLAEKFSVRGIPTLMIFQNGDQKDTKIGAVSKAQLSEFINKNVA